MIDLNKMKVFKQKFFAIILSAFCFSCSGEAYHEELNGGYYLSAIHAKEDMVLGYQDGEYGIGVLDATVFAVGQNDSFIVVKQHPRNFPDKPDKAIVNYYIVPLKSKIAKSADKSFYGPLSISEFENKEKDLGIKDIVFTRVFKDLE